MEALPGGLSKHHRQEVLIGFTLDMLEANASWLEAIGSRLEAIGSRY